MVPIWNVGSKGVRSWHCPANGYDALLQRVATPTRYLVLEDPLINTPSKYILIFIPAPQTSDFLRSILHIILLVKFSCCVETDWVVHATLATHANLATLAALGVIFRAFPALRSFEPRRPRRDMQAVPCGARSDTRLLPASASQPPPVDIRSVREYNTWICLYVKVKTVLIFSDTSSSPARKETPANPHPHAFARDSTSTPPRGGRAPVYPWVHHAHEPMAKSALKKVGSKSGLETSNANDTHSLRYSKPSNIYIAPWEPPRCIC